MAVSQHALKADPDPDPARSAHRHTDPQTCPTCEQPVAADLIEKMQARIEARDRDRTALISTRLLEQHAKDKAEALDHANRQSAEEIAVAREEARLAAEATAAVQLGEAQAARIAADKSRLALEKQIEQLRLEGEAAVKTAKEEARIAAEAAAADLLAAANAAKLAAEEGRAVVEGRLEKLRLDSEAAVAKVKEEATAREAIVRQEVAAQAEAALRETISIAEAAKVAAELKATAAELQAQAIKETFETQLTASLREQREILEQAGAAAVNAEKAAAAAEKLKLLDKVGELERTIDKKTAEELGEAAEADLLDVLKAEFDTDRITRIGKGKQGADILHVVIHNGKECGTIIYDSKNREAWRTEYVTKLKADQMAAKAEHAVLATRKFPAGARHLEIQDGVVLVVPTRVIPLVQIIRQHILQMHTLKFSNEKRTQKTAALYTFITSQRCADLLQRIDAHAETLLDIQVKEKKAHDAVWKRQGEELRAVQKVRAELVNDIDMIIGTADAREVADE